MVYLMTTQNKTILSRETKTQAQGLMLHNRLQKRYRHLNKWAQRQGVNVFRLYDRDIPEIPLVLDWYGNGVSGSLYRRPYEKDEAEERRWLTAMSAAIATALAIPPDQVFLKERKRQRGKAQYQPYRSPDRQTSIREVCEGGLSFRVNLSDYLDTGLFVDRRKLRQKVREAAAGKRVLNLFCYTGAFSVYAAAGGAAEIDSVDISNTYLDWAQTNFRINGFDSRRVDVPRRDPLELDRPGLPRYRFIRRDVLSFLVQASGLSWDLIILDPPSFSNSKAMYTTLDIRRDYQKLITQCLAILNPGGVLYFSVNAKGFKLNPRDFPGITIQDWYAELMDEDFRGKRLPACYTLTSGFEADA
ncbi:MAG: class I SAM-dependent methyltransferase [Spirochaetaceae bacterium]|jgi:23S rRNA G2069 N7-methylase RlmK/C1962 C5-methylase RlmI|nr:class I SAM-dependent methyltransferase [Spirochaetaceae bacterium]